MKLFTSRQMQELDRATISDIGIPGIVLMENAGRGVYQAIEARIPDARAKRIVVLCGRGNNGGDGFVIARCFHGAGAHVVALLFSAPDALRGDAKTNLDAFKNMGGDIRQITDESHWHAALPELRHAAIVVDALLGTGLSTEVTGLYRSAIEEVNRLDRAFTVAVDIPSGIDATTGEVLGAAVRARLTCTFACPKRGLALHPGAECAGELAVLDIGIPPGLIAESPASDHLLDRGLLAGSIPARRPDSHKGAYGHALILAGSPGKTGAAAMAAQAAMRSGAGLVTLGVPVSLNPVLEAKSLEVMTEPLPEEVGAFLGPLAWPKISGILPGKSTVAIGPGMGDHEQSAGLLVRLIESATVPLIIDADGLNVLSRNVSALKLLKQPAVLTPHPGEMARLAGLSVREVQADRIGLSCTFAKKYNVIIVLKGSRTIIAAPDGSAYVNPTGNPGMASGGMGDVLTGMIAGLAAQGLEPLRAALLSVYAHGLIGDAVAAERGGLGILASDIIERIPIMLAQFAARAC